MQAGFLWEDNNLLSHRAFQTSSDPVRFVLDLPFEEPPGIKFKYCTGASHVLGAIVAKYVKTDLRSFADSTLFKYIGVSIQDWN